MNFVYGDEVSEWVRKSLGVESFGPHSAIGIDDGGLICGVVYSNFIQHKGKPLSMEVSIVAVNRKWCTRKNLRVLFSYPFLQIGVERLQATIATDNLRAREFNVRLGFKVEGIGRRAYFDGRDCVVSSMLKNECRWING